MSEVMKKFECNAADSDNQYLLAIAISKRVRALKDGTPPLVEDIDSHREPIRTAITEFAEKKLIYKLEEEPEKKSTERT